MGRPRNIGEGFKEYLGSFQRVELGIVSPCLGCKNASAFNPTEINLTGSPVCPRKLLQSAPKGNEIFVQPEEIVGLPINPVKVGNLYYIWAARDSINLFSSNPEFTTEKIACDSRPYILFYPQAFYESMGEPRQNDEVYLVPTEILISNTLFAGLAFPSEINLKEFVAAEKAVSGIISGTTGRSL